MSLSIPTVPQTVDDACAVFLRWLVIVGCWPELGDDLVSYYDCSVDVHRSARKHGVAEEDAIHAARGIWSPTRCRTMIRRGHAVSCGWGRIVRAIS